MVATCVADTVHLHFGLGATDGRDRGRGVDVQRVAEMRGEAVGFSTGEVALTAVARGADAVAAGQGWRGLFSDFNDFDVGVALMLRVGHAHVV